MKRLFVVVLGLFLSMLLLQAKGVVTHEGADSDVATLQGHVWWDENLNGIQDEAGKGIAGIRVHLYKNGEDTGEMVETETMGEGNYTFTNLDPEAKYTVKIDLPKNYPDFTLQNKGDDSSKDSDIVNWPWRSESVYLKGGDVGILDAGLVCKVCAQLHMEKYTNDVLVNEESDIPYIKVGDTVTWKYKIYNDSTKVTIDNIAVTDDKEGNISCPQDSLEPGESMECIKTGIAQEGNYSNMGSVVGTTPEKNVTDEYPSNYYGYIASIDIEKLTNGEDADSGSGPNLSVGSKVTWTYKVKNSGNVKLTDIVVKDDKEGVITCPKTELAAGESMTCTKEGIVKEGQYTNEATVTGKDPQGNSQTDSDTSHYVGKVGACIGDLVWLDTNANGIQDATESGLAGVKVELLDENGNPTVDINGTAIAPQTTSEDGKYKFCGLGDGKYIVKVTLPEGYLPSPKDQGGDESKDSDIDPVTEKTAPVELHDGDNNMDVDAGAYPNRPSIDIEKLTNGEDADSGSGPNLSVGSKVTWTYKVKNSGNVKLTDIVVKDDKEGVITCPKTELAAGESMTCTKEGIVKEGQYTNEATVTGKDPQGNSQTDSDTSHYVGIIEGACLGDILWYDKNLNGIQDAGEPGVIDIGVSLYNESGTLLATTQTDSNGNYKFCGLKPGKYKVKFDQPHTYLFTLQDKGGDDTKDSDVDDSGWSHIVTLEDGQNNMTVDAGIYCECDDYEVHPQEYKEVSASFNPLAIIGLLIFIYIATLTVRQKEN